VAAPLLPRYLLVDEQAARELRVTLALNGSESSVSTPVGRNTRKSQVGTAGGDARALRGIPAVSRSGIGSAIPGTQPEQVVCGGDEL
jgi:hypothetical protein